ncbi:ABC transporter permease [Pseudomonas carassii]|uniref:Transport permease protein n=1 Tax=Pseudomonas carassii TaxID=3115855 RepID=A0ABU7HC09_9PSED|nr:ABC transporter permease [Pseudomonas sp. 137P]MEE1888741.1 ABC transporter permease [Pseudomonas sp. 137P]
MMRIAKLSRDSFRSLMMWRVWMFLGGQDIKARFRRSFFGPLWMVMTTAFFVGGVGAVYGLLFGQPVAEFLPYLACGFTIWGFLVTSIVEASTAYVRAEGYIKQFSYPKQIYLLRNLVSASIALLIGLLVIVPVQGFFHQLNVMGWLLAIPGVMLLLLAALGHITVSAYLGTRFRDFPHAMSVLLQMLFFITPIMFPAKVLQAKGLDFVYQFNPLYYLIDVVRTPILTADFASVESYAFAALYIVCCWFVALLIALKLDSRVVFLL